MKRTTVELNVWLEYDFEDMEALDIEWSEKHAAELECLIRQRFGVDATVEVHAVGRHPSRERIGNHGGFTPQAVR